MEWKRIILAVGLSTLTGCTFGMHMDRIDDGSELQATYKRNRFTDTKSGMDYMRSYIDRQQEPALPMVEGSRYVRPSPKSGWGW